MEVRHLPWTQKWINFCGYIVAGTLWCFQEVTTAVCGRPPKCKTLLGASTRLTCKRVIVTVSTTASASCLRLTLRAFSGRARPLRSGTRRARSWWPSGSGAVRIKALSHRAPLVWVAGLVLAMLMTGSLLHCEAFLFYVREAEWSASSRSESLVATTYDPSNVSCGPGGVKDGVGGGTV